MNALQIEQRQAADVTILDLRGDITIETEAGKLAGTIKNLVEAGRRKILLNLERVIYVDSCGLGKMISSYNIVRYGGGQIKLLNLTRRVEELMVITKLVTVFEVYTDEASALSSYR